ncbi:hypothetical protein THIOM_005004 [Candidatus Thiomargarita nelsonii]|uniref:Uncharacterized protein n=1 Tax=Candidatus Thiomargarita nelsonii TaxID=1003181 RepID=A0A0A6P0N9_9GAMM|nr:hypothetical protein THIOM_005004 [Candidatus Thiomargarita nelsonii]
MKKVLVSLICNEIELIECYDNLQYKIKTVKYLRIAVKHYRESLTIVLGYQGTGSGVWGICYPLENRSASRA